MSTQVLKLIETDSEFLEKAANKVTCEGEEWFYMPFWFKKTGNGLFQEHRFSQLPDYLKRQIRNERGEGNQNND